ncbi:MAG: mannose-1-phosphate guanylyltransferase/mannose-6-phosphate isomerase [Pseudomonadota bacterium]
MNELRYYSNSMQVRPVILSGGAGTRLWPLSRATYPKQLMPLLSEESLLQETARRVGVEHGFLPPLVVCNAEHRFMVAEQLRAIGAVPEAILLEPIGRNTAPAAAVAAVLASESDPDAILLLLPSDHHVADPERFREAVTTALPAARAGFLVIFGIAPNRPETGYGYIRLGKPLAEAPGCLQVAQFVEKPDLATARRYVMTGDHFWNGGMVLFSARRFLAELERLEPAMLAAVRRAVAVAARDLDFTRLGEAEFATAPAKSIDYAVLERTEAAAVVPCDMGWSDVGSWDSLWEAAEKDEDGNVLVGDVVATDVKNSYLRAEGRLLAVQGLSGVVAVETPDAVLVLARNKAQDLRSVVAALDRNGREEHIRHRKVYRPWGSYEQVDAGDRFQVKRLIVRPGGKLSLQRHAHRAEHWVVVRGTARVTRDGQLFDLVANQSTYIPLGAAHRLENPGDEPLHIIEVQSGGYLGEDDIVRLEDVYGR